MLDIVVVLAVLSSLLVVVALSQPLAGRLRLSPVVLLAVIGAAIGGASGVLLHGPLSPRIGEAVTLFANLPVGSETFIYVFLPLLVFEAAFTSDVRRILEDAAPILMLAVVATVVTAVIVGLALWPFAGTPLVVCLLLGAVVSTTDPAAVIALFRDVGAPARLTRLVAGEALLNDAAAIVLYTVLLGIIISGSRPVIGGGAIEFIRSFIGGGVLGVVAGRAFLQVIPWLRDDRLAEGTLTVALAYLAFIAAESLFHVSGVVAVLASGMTVSFFGRSRIGPDNWSFLTDLWEQIAFWAHSLVFLVASILIPKLLFDVRLHDLTLVAVLIVAAFAARLAVLFLLLPVLSLVRLTKPISTVYKLAIAWGGLRGALTLVLALGVTENPAAPLEVRRFVGVLATGLVLFTLLVNGTTLRATIRLLGLDRLSPLGRLLRDRVLELTYADTSEMIAKTAKDYGLQPSAVERALAPYEAWTKAERTRDRDGESALTERARLAVALVALGNQERMLVLEMLARGAASPAALQALMRNAEALIEGARSGGRLGYKRAVEAALAFPLSFRVAYFFYRRLGVRRFLADRLGDRFETLLVTRLIIHDLSAGVAKRSRSIFGERAVALIDQMLEARLERTTSALDALRRQYAGYAAALEAEIPAAVGAAPRNGPIPSPVRRRPDLRRSLSGSREHRRGGPTRRSSASLRHRPRYERSHASTRSVQGSRRPAPPSRAEAAAAPFHRAQRTHRAQRRARRRHVLHRLGRGRGGVSKPSHSTGQRRRLRRNVPAHRRVAPGRHPSPDLLPAARSAQDRFRSLHARQPRRAAEDPSDRRGAGGAEPGRSGGGGGVEKRTYMVAMILL